MCGGMDIMQERPMNSHNVWPRCVAKRKATN